MSKSTAESAGLPFSSQEEVLTPSTYPEHRILRNMVEGREGRVAFLLFSSVIAITLAVFARPLTELWRASTAPLVDKPPQILEIADDTGQVDWRAPLERTTDTVVKTLALPSGFDASDYRKIALKILMAGASFPEDGGRHTYDLAVRVDDTVVQRYSGGPPEDAGWQEIPLDPELLRGKDQVIVAVTVSGKPDQSANYTNIYGASGWSAHRSYFNGNADDLSPDQGAQNGEYLIRLALEAKPLGRAGDELPFIVALPTIAFVLFASPWGWRRGAVLGLVGFCAGLTAFFFGIAMLAPLLLAIALAVNWGLLFLRARASASARQRAVLSSLLALLWLSFALRWYELLGRVGARLDPDAIGYRALADSSRTLFDTDYREPLFIWLVKISFSIFGSSDLALRYVTVVLSLILIVAVFWFARKFAGNGVALLSAIFVATSQVWVTSSARGLRTELFAITVLLFIGAVFHRRAQTLEAMTRPQGITARPSLFAVSRLWGRFKGDSLNLLAMGAAGALLSLTQITSLAFVVPLTLYGLWHRGRPLWWAVIPFGLIGMFVAPHLANNYLTHGDPMYSSDFHAVWYRNLEFAGQPGYITLEQRSTSPYSGTFLTTLQYIFGLHSLSEVASRVILGLKETLLQNFILNYMLPTRNILLTSPLASPIAGTLESVVPILRDAFFLLYLVGLVRLAFSANRFLLVTMFAAALPTAFLVRLDLDPRLVMHLQPFVAFCIAAGLLGTGRRAWPHQGEYLPSLQPIWRS